MEEKARTTIALSIVGLYATVVLVMLVWSLFHTDGDISAFFENLNKANFLLGPVGFVMGYYFKNGESNNENP
ncbi:hypothetical protein VH1709_contig00050-0058 [Vibrio harveyi]|uniref:hypothetical protein n=1 Tax=Vibrio harveyi TaxID=669 RepID=UPI000D78C44E|nr:hypothetical protein [Vibrio harveyi]MCQ9085583.1 hypothetical protein [Vibrio harveyi]GBL00741.1 hypothetical protein VH1709_contig00050-0058 [Vibrio harveyi]